MKLFGRSDGIRSDLIRSILIGAGLLILGMVVFLDFSLRKFLLAREDGDLMHRAQALMSLVKEDEDGIEFDYFGGMMPEFDRVDGSEFFEIWLPENQLLARSNSLSNKALPFSPRVREGALFENVELKGVGPCRLLHLSFHPAKELEGDDDEEDGAATVENARDELADEDEDGDESEQEDEEETSALARSDATATLVLLRKRDAFDQFLSRIRLLLFGVGGGVLVLLVFLVQSSLKRGLHPLEEIRKQLMAIQPHLLKTRIRLAKPVVELKPVVEQLNALFARLEDAVHREKRFTSDVAHELRTPLAELRTLAEVGLQDPGDQATVLQFFDDVREITLEMQVLVTHLLELARCESDIQVVQFESVDFVALIEKMKHRLLGDLTETELVETLDPMAPRFVCSDEAWLELTLQNLFKNAVSHRKDHGVIHMKVEAGAGQLIFILQNPTDVLEKADLAHVFERFWQKDSARTGGKNTGLGLALVKSLCQCLGIDVHVSLQENKFTITLQIPVFPTVQTKTQKSKPH